MDNTIKQLKCPSCELEIEHEIIFERIEENIESINLMCPQCGCATTHGQRMNSEEFYY